MPQRWLKLAAAWFFAMVFLVPTCSPAMAQNVVEATAPDARVPVPESPTAITVQFTGALDPAAEFSLIVIDQSGQLMPLAAPLVVGANLSAPVTTALTPGQYAALWSAQLATEAAPRVGSFGFQIGGSSGVPGQALALGAQPDLWVVLARAVFIAGLGLALAGAVKLHFPGPGQTGWLPVLGAALAVASAIGVTLLLPGRGGSSEDAGPGGWLLLGGAILTLLSLVGRRVRPRSVLGALFAGLAVLAALVALVALGRWSAVATLTPGPLLVVIAMSLLPAAVALLIAGCVLSGTNPQTFEEPIRGRPLLGATIAIALIAIGLTIVLAVADLGFLGAGWFGLTAMLAAVALFLALFLVMLLRRHRAGGVAGAVLAAVTAVGVAGLGLTVPGALAVDPVALHAVDIVAPVGDVADAALMHLVVVPSLPGTNGVAAYVTDPAGAPQAAPATTAVTLTDLTGAGESTTIVLQAAPGTPFLIGALPLAHVGWWQASLATGAAGDATFELLAPDPNVSGTGPRPATDPAAAAAFGVALDQLTNLRNVQLVVNLGSGRGTHGQTTVDLNVGGDAIPPSSRETSAQYGTVTIGATQWVRLFDGRWQERPAGTITSPATWRSTYDHATGFQFGATVPNPSGEGEAVQVLTFYSPRQLSPPQEPAWFAWWIGTESGQVHREAMISAQHYMVYQYSGFNVPIPIDPPEQVPAGMSATPVAGAEAPPVASPAAP